jgi:hypothetical protein
MLRHSGAADIESLVLVVMMGAAQGMTDDLKQIMAEVKSMTAAKQNLRDLISKVARDVVVSTVAGVQGKEVGFARNGLGGERAYHRVPIPVPDPDSPGGVQTVAVDLVESRIATLDTLRAVQDDLKGRLDSMNEMSEMTWLRLQMAMDRRSKFIEALSNLMKQISTPRTVWSRTSSSWTHGWDRAEGSATAG